MRRVINRLALLAVGLLACGVLSAAGDEELLHPDQAYALDTRMEGDTLVARWVIAPGYYLYRSKFGFSAPGGSVILGEAQIPDGKIKEDEFFGRMEIYRDVVEARIPVTASDLRGGEFVLEAKSQGCADIGVCYPPHTQTRTVAFTPASSPAPASGGIATLLGGSQDEPEFLDPNQAYQFSARWVDDAHLLARWEIADGYYLYRSKFKFSVPSAPDAVLGEPQLPDGKVKEDEFFGRMEVYYHSVEALIPVTFEGSIPRAITFEAGYQGCAEAGLCYPPMTKSVELQPGQLVSASEPNAQSKAQSAGGALTEQDRLANLLADGKLWTILPIFFGLGLLLTFTPCVLPMIPILSGIIVGQGKNCSTRKAFLLSTTYVLAMASAYTMAGVIAGLFGSNLQAAFQDPWILGASAAVFVALSLSMFGFYDLQVPASLQGKLSQLSNQREGGTYIGVGVMGFLSALIVGPCVAAPLAGALIYIGQTGDGVLGGLALFALSMGMGAPLILIGTTEGKLIPKAGPWMDAIKAVFGVILLGVAIWLLERILPGPVTLLLWGALLVISAVYMGALTRLQPGTSGWGKLWKGLGLVFVVWGGAMILGAASGGSDPLHPLKTVIGPSANSQGTSAPIQPQFRRFKSVADLDAAVRAARSEGRMVMVDFYADWCISCKEMEKYTFSDPQVQELMGRFTLLQADVTDNDAVDKELLARFGLFGPPTILFYGSDGIERNQLRVMGFMDAREFSNHLLRVAES